ncbi:MAG: hypothetical protein JRM74_05375 [Nitrososphaerota archaeon]|nr:hypothetical protein [Nitrososphaerota archaeon]MDG6973525.1 hypothetical protein [Nitrososphaerota archaeon]MDG6982869.1 hypothetical protein [Nitrososphaerota archaeon]MDG6987347.1 hypothetical protein [Nitrososphaerota archaeon]
MSPLLIAAVAWFHLFFAVVWIGSSIMFFVVLGPVVSRLTPVSRAEFTVMFFPKMERFMNLVVPLLLLSGAALFAVMSWGDGFVLDAWSGSVVAGGTLGLVTYLFALAKLVPAARKVTIFLQDGGSEEELIGAQRLVGQASAIELVLMLATFTVMVAAGFL